jgi:hypothetical protein
MIGGCSWKFSKFFRQGDGSEKKHLIADWSSI